MHEDLVQPYLPCTDLWVITTHYNPAGYAARRENFERFAQSLHASGIPLVTVECAFGEEAFELVPAPDVIQVRGRDVMWMKERLLNLALDRLPAHATKVAWVDADLLFTNPAWAQQTCTLLDRWPIVQPFAWVVQAGQGPEVAPGRPTAGFAYQHQLLRRLFSASHGMSGGAWAAQRDLVQRHGIYDAAIVGSGDLLWVHASTGRFDSPPVRVITGASRKPRRSSLSPLLARRLERWQQVHWWGDRQMRRIRAELPELATSDQALFHYLTWAANWYADVRGRMTFTPGTVLHLWHGALDKRQYGKRLEIIRRHRFDPAIDLQSNSQGVWEWASSKPELHREVADYFWSRQEDDATQ